MRVSVRFIGAAALAVVAAVLLMVTSATSVYTLTATWYILPGSTSLPPFTDQVDIGRAAPYITGTTGSSNPSQILVLNHFALPSSPDEIESDSVIFGYSQGARTATTYKQNFNQYWSNINPGVPPNISFVVIGNPDRPSGGTNSRLNLGATPTETAGAIPGEITTYDITRQYDGISDEPLNQLNFLAAANASMGYFLLHSDYGVIDMSQAVPQGAYGDTAYYLIPTYPLPLLMPLHLIPGVGPILADMWDPALRVLVEAGYDRTINPGVPTPYNPLYSPDPTELANNFSLAMSTGMDNALEDLGMGRPSGTERPGPYGVGSYPVTMDLITDHQQLAPMAAPTESASPPAGPVDNSGASADTLDLVQQDASKPPSNPPTEAGGTSAAKPVLTGPTPDVTPPAVSRVCVGRST